MMLSKQCPKTKTIGYPLCSRKSVKIMSILEIWNTSGVTLHFYLYETNNIINWNAIFWICSSLNFWWQTISYCYFIHLKWHTFIGATYICNICVVRIVSNISKSYLFMSKRRTTTLSQAYRFSSVIYGQLNWHLI